MISDEIKMMYHNEYDYIMGLFEIFKLKHPESYPLVAKTLEKYREHVKRSGNIDDLPPVPQP